MVQNYVSPCEKTDDVTNLISIFSTFLFSFRYLYDKQNKKDEEKNGFFFLYTFFFFLTTGHDINHTLKEVY